MEVLEKMLTYREYREMEFDDDDNFQYELIEGQLSKKTPNSIKHQRVSGDITFLLSNFLIQNPIGEVLFAPLDVVLNEYNAVQPDVFYVSKNKEYILNEVEQVVIGIPDIIVEILSPSSVKRDRITKKKIYEQFGVTEFWLVDPSYKNVEVFRLVEGAFELADFVEENGTVKSTVLEGFELPLDKIF
jgi:Uma2 family endonuclease